MMQNFTHIIFESKNNTIVLTKSDITEYLDKVSQIIPTIVKNTIYLTLKYQLFDKDLLEEIRKSSKSSLKRIGGRYNIPESELEDLWDLLKNLKLNINLLPQYMNDGERKMFMNGRLIMSDLTIDLSSSQGRNAVTKMYMPLIYKIVNQYVGKSKLSKPELVSAALEGFTNAMNEWDHSKNVPFKTYAGERVRQRILNDINEFGHSLSGTSWYSQAKGYNADALSLDGVLGQDKDGDFKQDRLAYLGTTEDETKVLTSDHLKPLFDILEKKFSQRDIDIFYRYFGLNGVDRMKSKDIAKMYNMSEGNIRNSIINKIIKFLRNDSKSIQLLSELHESYSITLMTNLMGQDYQFILETLSNDDVFLLLEELNIWSNKEIFSQMIDSYKEQVNKSDSEYILSILRGDFETLDSSFRKHKKIIINFLNHMHPTETMNRKTDVSLLDYMVELQNAYKNHKLK